MPDLPQKTTARMAAWNFPPLVYKPAHHFWLSKDETNHQLLHMKIFIYSLIIFMKIRIIYRK